MFLEPKIFQGRAPEFLDLHYKIGADTDHVAKFLGDRKRELGDPVANLKNITSKNKAFRNYCTVPLKCIYMSRQRCVITCFSTFNHLFVVVL